MKVRWLPVDIEWIGKPLPRHEVVPTRMLNKKQVLEMIGVAPTNPVKNEIFGRLNQYDNPFNSQAVFREEDVIGLIRSFPVVKRGN